MVRSANDPKKLKANFFSPQAQSQPTLSAYQKQQKPKKIGASKKWTKFFETSIMNSSGGTIKVNIAHPSKSGGKEIESKPLPPPPLTAREHQNKVNYSNGESINIQLDTKEPVGPEPSRKVFSPVYKIDLLKEP